MPDHIEDFLRTRRAENASPNTIRLYRRHITQLEQFVGGNKWATQLSAPVLRAFLVMLSGKGIVASSRSCKLAALKSFVLYLRQLGAISDDAAYGIMTLKKPKLRQKLPDVPSQEDMACLLNGDFPTAFPERDRLILELLYGAGLRVSEAAHIRLDDLRPEQQAILIHGKGGMYGKAGKVRLAPLNRVSQRALGEYIQARSRILEERGVESQVLFFAVRNRYKRGVASLEPINVRSISRMLVSMTQLRGLRRMNPHLLRHACATHLLENGCPLDVIAEVLGHDNLDITAHYAQVSTRLMMTSYNRAHPHAKP